MRKFENPAKAATRSYRLALRDFEKQENAFALFQAGEAARRVGDHALSERLFHRCLKAGWSEGDKTTMAWGLWGLATLKRLAGEFSAAIEAYHLASDCAAEGGNADCLAWARAGHAEIIRHRRDHSAAVKHHEGLLEVFRENSDAVGELWALQGIGQIHLVNDSPKADEFFRRAEDLAREIGDLRAIGFSRRALGMGARRRGDLARAKRLLVEAGGIFESLDYTVGMGFVLRELAHCEIVAGGLDEAGQLAREALTRFGDGFPLGRAWALATLAQVEKETGARSQITLARSARLFTALGVDIDLGVPQVQHTRRLFLSGGWNGEEGMEVDRFCRPVVVVTERGKEKPGC